MKGIGRSVKGPIKGLLSSRGYELTASLDEAGAAQDDPRIVTASWSTSGSRRRR